MSRFRDAALCSRPLAALLASKIRMQNSKLTRTEEEPPLLPEPAPPSPAGLHDAMSMLYAQMARQDQNGFATAFEQIESTLSAHSFNFYVTAPGGNYEFDVEAQLFVGKNNTAGAGSVAGCFGPGTVTVEQVKNFSFNTPIGF